MRHCYCGRSFAPGNAWDSHVKTCTAMEAAVPAWRELLGRVVVRGVEILHLWVLAVPAVVAGIAVARFLGLLRTAP